MSDVHPVASYIIIAIIMLSLIPLCNHRHSYVIIVMIMSSLIPLCSHRHSYVIIVIIMLSSLSSSWWWWWCRPNPVREHAQDLRPRSGPAQLLPHTSSSAATPTGSVHKSQTVSVVGMSGQLKRCNESWFGSLQSGQFAAGWLAGSILCR